jgi:hypothetical protein
MLFCSSLAQDCAAQVRRYQPVTSTLSPYLNLTRFNAGGLPNYYALVRPQIQQQQINQQRQESALQQERQITRLENDVQRGLLPASPTGTGSWFMVPGVSTRFLDTSGYYPEPVSRAGRR